jgi:hypothetical protein
MNKIKGLDKLQELRASLPGEPSPTADPKDEALHALIDLWVAVSKNKTDIPLLVRAALDNVNKIIRPLLHD